VSEILAGKRAMTKEQAKKLAAFFMSAWNCLFEAWPFGRHVDLNRTGVSALDSDVAGVRDDRPTIRRQS
jgi:hypothetical protein